MANATYDKDSLKVIKCMKITLGKFVKVGDSIIVGTNEGDLEPDISKCPYSCCK